MLGYKINWREAGRTRIVQYVRTEAAKETG